mmetsp:Transcript_20025/g.55711  ORF Transcript_20025/g.55711 Transcript_20025/m.55711 type:complete len:223 (-) Transcript_20025:349-1017(-)
MAHDDFLHLSIPAFLHELDKLVRFDPLDEFPHCEQPILVFVHLRSDFHGFLESDLTLENLLQAVCHLLAGQNAIHVLVEEVELVTNLDFHSRQLYLDLVHHRFDALSQPINNGIDDHVLFLLDFVINEGGINVIFSLWNNLGVSSSKRITCVRCIPQMSIGCKGGARLSLRLGCFVSLSDLCSGNGCVIKLAVRDLVRLRFLLLLLLLLQFGFIRINTFRRR